MTVLKQPLIRALALATLLFSGAAAAHPQLQRSVPADGERLRQSPAELQLHFSGEVRLLHMSLEETAAGQIKLAFMPGAVPARDISVPLPALEAGDYAVSWTAMGGDGRKMSGIFSFTVGEEK